jgi:hypothetical protein
MGEQRPESVGRRGLVAGLAALAGAVLAKLGTAGRVAAANGDALLIGASHTGTQRTFLSHEAKPAATEHN